MSMNPCDAAVPACVRVAQEALHIRPIRTPESTDLASICEVHTWSEDKLMTDLMPLMRERHDKGGVDVCITCIHRAKAAADRRRGQAPT